MDETTLFFFRDHPGALGIYETLEQRIQEEFPGVEIRVQKTQISFYNPRLFACASFLGVRKKRELPEPYLVVTFGLGRREGSGRIAAAVEPYPNRWTHHVVLSEPEEADEELMGWIREAAAFAAKKRSKRRRPIGTN